MSLIKKLREEKQMQYLAVSASLRGFRDNLRTVVLQPFAISLGISMSSIGALESLMDLARTIVMPMLGAASDIYGRKRFLILRELAILGSFLCLLFAKSWLLLAVGMILIGFGSALLAIWQTVVAEASPPNETGLYYSVLGSAYMATGLLGTLAAGWLAAHYGYSMVFTIATVVTFVTLVVTIYRIDETHSPESGRGLTPLIAFKSILDSFRPKRYLWGYYLAMTLDLFAFNIGWRLLNGMLTQEFGFTPVMLGLMTAVNTGTTAVLQVTVGRRMERHGYVKYLVISQLISCTLLAILLFNQTFKVAILVNLLMGVAAAFWLPAEQTWIAVNVDPRERAKAIGGFSTFKGLLGLPAPYLGGILFDRYGFTVPILVNFALAVIDIGFFVYLVKDNARRDA